MTLIKRLRLAALVACATLITCLCLVGCGEPVAATYNGGSIPEEDVTNTIRNMRAYYGLEDQEKWDEFVKTRQYDTGTSVAQTAVEKAAAGAAAAAGKTNEDQTEGTEEDMRAYVIEQLIRSELIEKEIKNRNLVVDEETVDAYVEQQRTFIESRIMEGVFESVLQRQGYKDLEEYKDEIREQLKQVLLQNEVSTVTLDDGQVISGKAAWNYWFDQLYEKSNVKINPAPQPLDYSVVIEEESGE